MTTSAEPPPDAVRAQLKRILQSDENVKAILINIFGGILRCDRLANGVVQAAEKVGMRVPVIIRMEGTNLKEGRGVEAIIDFIVREGMLEKK